MGQGSLTLGLKGFGPSLASNKSTTMGSQPGSGLDEPAYRAEPTCKGDGQAVNIAMGWLGTPVWAQQQLVELDWNTKVRWALWLLVGFFGVFPGIVAYMVWLERKVAARFQDRIGPNRVGPLGLLQPIADALKLITKEDLVPRTADKWVHLAAPVLVIVSAFLVIAVIPFAVGMAPVNLPSGLVYLIAVSSISPLGIFLAGWSSRNKYSLLGAMRSVAQLVSYEVPQVLSTIPIILWTGSLSLVSIFDKQLAYGWFIASPPGLLAFGDPADRQHRRSQPNSVRPSGG